VPEMLVAARAMQAGLKLLKPQLVQAGVPATGKVVLGTVEGDLHDIGKSLVGMMLGGTGFEVIDLGTDVGPEKFSEPVRAYDPQLVGMSALLTTTMQNMKPTLEALEDMGVRTQVKVMVGGAPVTDMFAGEIGADGFTPNASRAVTLAKSLLQRNGGLEKTRAGGCWPSRFLGGGLRIRFRPVRASPTARTRKVRGQCGQDPGKKANSSRFPLRADRKGGGVDLVGAEGLEPPTSRM
jgi:5-methyltetrahydrofolate--homocysteine methyltransferase